MAADDKKVTVVAVKDVTQKPLSFPDSGRVIILVPENGSIPVNVLMGIKGLSTEFRCFEGSDEALMFEAGRLSVQYPGADIITDNELLRTLMKKAVPTQEPKARKRTPRAKNSAKDAGKRRKVKKEQEAEPPAKPAADFMPKPEPVTPKESGKPSEASYLSVIKSVKGAEVYKNIILDALKDTDEITCAMKIRMSLAVAGVSDSDCSRIAEEIEKKLYPKRCA